jgi:hypothetical protein
MPTNRRRRTQPIRSDEYSERTIIRLETGHDWDWLESMGTDPLTDEQLKAVWDEVRDDFLTEFTSRHPGTRPWAWWHFEAPEPRRQVRDGPRVDLSGGYWFGKPAWYSGMPPDDMFESERDYLQRLGLLFPHE